MSDEIHIHVPHGAKIIIHIDNQDPKPNPYVTIVPPPIFVPFSPYPQPPYKVTCGSTTTPDSLKHLIAWN